MKLAFLSPLILLIGLLLPAQSGFAISGPALAHGTHASATTSPAVVAGASMSKRQLRKQAKANRKAVKKSLKEQMRAAGSDETTILLVILALFVAPLAMFLFEGGITNRFWISLLLWLLFVLPGAIYTIYVILTDS